MATLHHPQTTTKANKQRRDPAKYSLILRVSNPRPIMPPPTVNMEMKKIVCAALVAAASVSAVLAQEAPAPAPSAASAALPAVGSLVGASLLSFFAYYMH
ncbi:hypothetical protein Vadar_019112 [Vaccinium darrowii]|uniref:Uncharacterized protein n=1 Tax=Vaccinium darrowii TaxID=229202 RepID=A0ACB7ZCD6_9ERIC|nr:hypothetical protein Vadar_019112 [Vaccinium darrowii]